jgi:hypothetical protein
MANHPNTFAALATSVIAAGVLRVAHHYGYAHMTNEEALALTGGIIATVLFIGRRGLKAILVDGVKGSLSKLWNGAPKNAAPAK